MEQIIVIIGGISTILTIVLGIYQLKDRFTMTDKQKVKEIHKSGNMDTMPNPLFSLFKFGMFSKIPTKQAFIKAKEIAIKVENENYKPTIIVGIGRGGAIFGSLISYNLYNVPIVAIDRT